MLWSFEKYTTLTPSRKNLALLLRMSIICLMRGMSLMSIGAIYLLSLVCLLMRIMASFLRYTGNLHLKKTLYMSCFIANSSSCTTTELSIHLPSYLTAIKSK